MENASFGLTLCAERAALCAAVSAGCRRFRALAVVSDGKTAPVPCGACLQALSEFCGGGLAIFSAAAGNESKASILKLKDLFPQAFKLRFPQ